MKGLLLRNARHDSGIPGATIVDRVDSCIRGVGGKINGPAGFEIGGAVQTVVDHFDIVAPIAMIFGSYLRGNIFARNQVKVLAALITQSCNRWGRYKDGLPHCSEYFVER